MNNKYLWYERCNQRRAKEEQEAVQEYIKSISKDTGISFFDNPETECGGMTEVDHPTYYGGDDSPYEAIKVIETWGLDFCLGNAVKYINRAGKKDKSKEIEDLRKAIWYIKRRIKNLEDK